MSDFSGIQTIGSHGLAVRPSPLATQPVITSVDASAKAEGGDLRDQHKDQPLSTKDETRELLRNDPNLLPGPRPTFEASFLEVRSDLQNTINTIEAKRGLSLSDGAIAPMPSAPELIEEPAKDTNQTGENVADLSPYDTQAVQSADT